MGEVAETQLALLGGWADRPAAWGGSHWKGTGILAGCTQLHGTAQVESRIYKSHLPLPWPPWGPDVLLGLGSHGGT